MTAEVYLSEEMEFILLDAMDAYDEDASNNLDYQGWRTRAWYTEDAPEYVRPDGEVIRPSRWSFDLLMLSGLMDFDHDGEKQIFAINAGGRDRAAQIRAERNASNASKDGE